MQIVISLLGGLGLFLYGMNLMGESLEKVAGSKMKKIIEQRMVCLSSFIKIRNRIDMEKDTHHGTFSVNSVFDIFRI